MQTTNQIKVNPNRQRRAFDEEALGELANSIIDKGLLHPIVVRELDGELVLVAGERRMKAMSTNHLLGFAFKCDGVEVPAGEYPYVLVSDLTDIQIEEAELEENILRVDLSWQERSAAVARLHSLRALQSETGKQTIKATASELLGKEAAGQQIMDTRDDIILAQHLDDPDVAKAGSKKEAIKVLKKKMQKELRERLAEDYISDPSAKHVLENTDAVSYMQGMQSETLDVIIIDPPYNVDAHNFGSQVSTKHDYDDGEDIWPIMEQFAVQSMRVTKQQAHLYCFCDIRYFFKLAELFTTQGWDVIATPLIWYKTNGIGIIPRPEHGPRRTYECILYAIKGGRPVTAVYNDVIAIPADTQREHGAQKPVELYVDLLRRSVNPGDVVADFFCGSGPIFPAAEQLMCRAFGTDKSKANFMIAKERLDMMEGLNE